MKKKPGSSRDWGYASYDEEEDRLIYTSYEKDGSVNRYPENKDGGHGHMHWDKSEDYESDEPADSARKESNSSDNPSISEVYDNGGCYLTTACMQHMQQNFNDDCEELTVLRWFRDNFVSASDINYYYEVAPIIVKMLDTMSNNEQIYADIYNEVIKSCVQAIDNKNYEFAYNRYKKSVVALEEVIKPELACNLCKTLKKIK